MVLALAILGAPTSLQAADEAVDLKPKFKVGQRIVQQARTTQTQKIALLNAAVPMQQRTEQVQDYSLVVEKARPDGGYELALEILSMRIETKMGDQIIMKYDSKTGATTGGVNPATGLFKKLVGAKFKLLTKADGDVEKVEGIEELLAELATGMPDMVAGMVKSMFNEDLAKQMSGYPPDLPKEPVAAGREWPVKTEVSLGTMGTIVLSVKYKYTGMERRRDYECAVLDHKGFITSKEGAGSGAMSFSSISGTTTGRLYYAPQLGTTVESFSDQKMKMAMKVMGQDANIDMDQRVSTRMTELSGAVE